MSDAPFRRRTVVLLSVVAGASFLVTVVVTLFVDEVGAKPDAATNAFSTSALGHSVLVDLLEAADVPVVVSRSDTARRAGPDSLVLVLEPDVEAPADLERLREVLEHDGPMLVALPKWRGTLRRDRPEWLAEVHPRPRDDVETVLGVLDVGGTVARPAGAAGTFEAPDGEEVAPALRRRQLVRAARAVPRWDGPDGALLLELPRGRASRWILTDPDPIANHGIDEGDNARLMLDLVDRLRGGGPVFVDETVHGFVRSESVWTALLEFPLVAVLAHAVLLVGVVLAGAMRRFGAPEPLPAPFRPGKLVLIDNGARLLAAGDTAVHAAARQLESAVRRARDVLHAPDGLREAETLEWLREAGRRRGVTRDPVRLKEELKQLRARGASARTALVRFASDVHDWREEIENGP